MSEKIYAWFLRLYPSRFREEYSEDALQLFRDRARDERGLLHRLRFWLDLFADLVISLPREYYHFQPEFFGVSAQRVEGVPAFFVLEGGSPRPGALFSGGMLTLACIVVFSVSLSQPGRSRSLRALTTQSRGSARDYSSPFRRSTAPASTDSGEKVASTGQPADAAGSKPSSAKPGGSSSAAAMIDRVDRHRVIQGAISNIKQHYVDPDVAQKTADALLAHEKNGDYDGAKDGRAFADLLTRQMRDVSQDMNLNVVYSETPLPEHPQEPTREELARYRKALENQNCTFERVEILPHNIGYLKLNSFPDPAFCEATAKAAMSHLNDSDAMIFDLRDNRGGYPDMVMLMAAYLFDHPEYMYNPRENTTERSWTQSPVPGNRLADKPVYILTSGSTFSAAEHFSYDLKMLKRASLVGETTGGAAHSGVFHRIDEHFGMGIPETKPINPFSKSDWAVVGVEPDVKVNAADALETAIKLAQTKLEKK
ncbi:MAG TPA: S41 family peptidase [Candidatus Acidoferrum sp.]|nr:S41 family peptidase [Candidatus Acidoferrum sp.]